MQKDILEKLKVSTEWEGRKKVFKFMKKHLEKNQMIRKFRRHIEMQAIQEINLFNNKLINNNKILELIKENMKKDHKIKYNIM